MVAERMARYAERDAAAKVLGRRMLGLEREALAVLAACPDLRSAVEAAAVVAGQRSQVDRYRKHLEASLAVEEALGIVGLDGPARGALRRSRALLSKSVAVSWDLALGADRVAIAEARRARRPGEVDDDLEDRISLGRIGLLRATRRWDPERGVPFEAYAGHWVRATVWREVGQMRDDVTTPNQVHSIAMSARKLLRTGQADVADAAAFLGISEARVRLALSDPGLAAVRLDQEVERRGGKPGGLLHEQVPDPSLLDPEGEVADRLDRTYAHDLLARLRERDRRVLCLRFGIGGDGEPRTLREVGEALGLSKQRIAQVQSAALQTLREIAHGGT